MPDINFGLFLVHHGFIKQPQYDEAYTIYESLPGPFGMLAVQKKILSSKQAAEVIRHQRKLDEPFLEAAFIRKYIDTVQVGVLQQAEFDDDLLFAEAVVQCGLMSYQTANLYFIEFGKNKGKYTSRLRNKAALLSYSSPVDATMYLFPSLFRELVGENIRLMDIDVNPLRELFEEYHVVKQETKPGRGFALALQSYYIIRIGSEVYSQAFMNIDDEALTCAGSFLDKLLTNVEELMDPDQCEHQRNAPEVVTDLQSLPITYAYTFMGMDGEIVLMYYEE